MTSYSGKIIRKTPVTPTQTSASGVWTTADAAAAVKNNLWPVPGVPDPISRSLRFRASATAYLTRTYGTPTNNKVWTWSAWIKRGSLSLADANHLFMASPQDIGSNPTTYSRLVFETDNTLRLQSANSAGEAFTSNAVFRDPSAWYHIVLTMNAASTVVNCYVNGVEISYASRTNPTNTNTAINGSGNYHRMGLFRTAEPRCFDGYMAEVNFIDGQALTPSSFGTTNAFTGAWIPMPYTGTYGANGFYLNFKDNTSTTTIGYDYSGNANNWVANNISLTAGNTYDSMLDVPTNWVGYSATTDKSAVTRGNYCVISPIDKNLATITNGNLRMTGAGSTYQANGSMAFPASGKWYFEATVSANSNASNGLLVGIASPTRVVGSALSAAGTYGLYGSGASAIYSNGSNVASGLPVLNSTYTYQLAVDVDNGKAWVGYNTGSTQYWYNSTGGTTGDPAAGTNPTFTVALAGFFPLFQVDSASGYFWYANFGQRPFSYTPPTGFTTLCTTNLPTPTILNGDQYMAALLWTSTAAVKDVTGSNFQPDLVWVKSRASASANEGYHHLVDAVRGAGKVLSSNITDAEYWTGTNNSVQAFLPDGFTAGDSDGLNGNGMVSWLWKANGAAVSNTNGTLTSQVSANTTAGFSIATYTGTGSNATVGHGLGVAPSMIIVKSRSIAENWPVYHASMNASPASGRLILDGTAAFTASATSWNSTAPTSSVFSIGTATAVNTSSATYVAYCFAAVTGYSAFGKYTGNGSADGPFVYLGFRPRYLMVKRTDTLGAWTIWDSARDTYNVQALELEAQSSGAEQNLTGSAYDFDFLSNGVKFRGSGASQNASGGTYIYAAFAENPFNYSNAR